MITKQKASFSKPQHSILAWAHNGGKARMLHLYCVMILRPGISPVTQLVVTQRSRIWQFWVVEKLQLYKIYACRFLQLKRQDLQYLEYCKILELAASKMHFYFVNIHI